MNVVCYCVCTILCQIMFLHPITPAYAPVLEVTIMLKIMLV